MSEALLKIRLERLDEGGYLATSDDIPGLVAQGRTISETLASLHKRRSSK